MIEKEELEGVFMVLCDQRNDEQCLEVLRRWKSQIIEENCKCTVCKKCKATFCYSCAEKSDCEV
jgi:MarR-like DNA-binding transcriptional regulator SgrR of sgrS sRNA